VEKLSAWLEIENLKKIRDANLTYIEQLNSEIAEKEAAYLRKFGPVKIEVSIGIGGKESEFAEIKCQCLECKEGNDEQRK